MMWELLKTRTEILSEAAENCLKDLYSIVQPHVEWEDFLKENREYLKRDEEYHSIPDESKPDYREYVGPRPFEFYYLPQEVMKRICESYVNAYRIDSRQYFLDNIETLKNYCNSPIVDKYIEGELREDGTRWPGHRGYDHPDNLEKEIQKYLDSTNLVESYYPENELDPKYARDLKNKFFEFLDMAGNFFNWNKDLNSFNITVYLGPSPNSNKEAVIENWKKYRNQDIEIDESEYNDDESEYNDDDNE